MSQLTNYPFAEIEIGQRASYRRKIGERELLLFAAMSGDVNPVHLDEEFARETMFKGRIAHGMISGALISTALALELPGPGTIYLGQTLKFLSPVRIDDELTVDLEVTGKRQDRNIVTLATTVYNQHEKAVVQGEATVMAPAEKIEIERPREPEFSPAG